MWGSVFIIQALLDNKLLITIAARTLQVIIITNCDCDSPIVIVIHHAANLHPVLCDMKSVNGDACESVKGKLRMVATDSAYDFSKLFHSFSESFCWRFELCKIYVETKQYRSNDLSTSQGTNRVIAPKNCFKVRKICVEKFYFVFPFVLLLNIVHDGIE